MANKKSITKSEVLKELKAHKFSEKIQAKKTELMEAIKNATEENIELIEHKATLQVGYMELDITADGDTSKDDLGNFTRQTIHQQITSARHVWFIDGDVSVAEMSELRNGLSPNKESFKEVNFNSKCYGGYVYRASNADCAAEFIARVYSTDYFRKLNMHQHTSRANAYQFVAETDPYEQHYWEIYFNYVDSKGKKKRMKVGLVVEEDLTKERTVNFDFKFERSTSEKAKGVWKILKPILIVVGIVVFGLLWYFFMM